MTNTSKRYQALERTLRLARFLHGRARMPTYPRIAEEIGVCTRTAIRYVKVLRAAEWPLPPAADGTNRDDQPAAVESRQAWCSHVWDDTDPARFVCVRCEKVLVAGRP